MIMYILRLGSLIEQRLVQSDPLFLLGLKRIFELFLNFCQRIISLFFWSGFQNILISSANISLFDTNLLPRLLDDSFLFLSISVLWPWLQELFLVEFLAQTMHCMPTSLPFVTENIFINTMKIEFYQNTEIVLT